ncbi:hypothetical protein BOTBODRAFT_176343 [Botryobasidium botryosum FD-172 SS1]|uniref:Uncharacterized protein n=1 Tax=Botryobasidium botryosum (strain FD-172 SS1) TaxID=930990 RepID=A0A067MM53_BOTB1|nr:hypothetical protein BOTBODRAFT_176343 [Botryobasidium botryosum FD-172 SS1]
MRYPDKPAPGLIPLFAGLIPEALLVFPFLFRTFHLVSVYIYIAREDSVSSRYKALFPHPWWSHLGSHKSPRRSPSTLLFPCPPCALRRWPLASVSIPDTQSFAEDIELHIPQDHIFCTFGLIRNAEDTIYPTFIPLQRPAAQTAALACLASGHTFVGSYYKSWNIPDMEYSCPCGVDVQDIPHVFLELPWLPCNSALQTPPSRRRRNLSTSILFTDKLDSLLKWLKATNAFTKCFSLVTIGTPPPQGHGSLPSPPVLSVVD